MSCALSSVFFDSIRFDFLIFFFSFLYGELWGRRLGAGDRKKVVGSVIPIYKGREGVCVTLSAFFSFFCLCYLVLGIRDLGFGVSFDILVFDDSNGYYASHLWDKRGVHVCSYCSYLGPLLSSDHYHCDIIFLIYHGCAVIEISVIGCHSNAETSTTGCLISVTAK